MTRNEALKLINEKGALKYNGTQMLFLTKLVNSLSPGPSKKDADIDLKEIKKGKTVQTLCGWVGVGEKQLYKLFDSIDEVQHYHRKQGKVFYTLDFTPLNNFDTKRIAEKELEKQKRKKAKQAGYAAKARAVKKAKVDLETFRKVANDNKEKFFDLMLGKLKKKQEQDYEEYGLDGLPVYQTQQIARETAQAVMA